MGDLKLCFVYGSWAWFTSQDLSKQSGEYWDEKPYEIYAGEPFCPEGHTLVKVAFDLSLDEPRSKFYESPYSVNDINSGITPWLSGDGVNIYAGTTLSNFKIAVKSLNCNVYVAES